MNSHEDLELLTESKTAELLGLRNPKTLAVWRCTKRYDLPYVKYGRSVRYRLKDVRAFIESHLVLLHGSPQ
jgi:Helix-turn-helix domain